MKRIRKMLLLLLVLALLIAGYHAVSSMEKTQSVTESEGTFTLGEWTEDTLTGLAWTNEDGSFEFEKQDGEWVNALDTAFPVNQSALDNMAAKMIELTATREISDVTELANYGLDEPAFSVVLTDVQGNEITYAMGDETPFGDGYYLSVSGKTPIYTIESALDSTFDKSLTQLCRLEAIPEVDSVTRLNISGAIDAVYDEGSGLWHDSVTGETLDADEVEALVDMAKGIEWAALVTAHASDEALADYGLDEAQAVSVLLEGGEDTPMEILLGNADEDGNRCARLPGSAMVYTVEGESTEELLGAGMDTLWNRTPVMMAYDELASAAFTWDSGSVEITANAQAEVGGEDEAETDAADEAGKQENLWTQVTAFSGTERVEYTAQGEPLLTISYTGQDGSAGSAAIYAYSVESYLLPMTDTHAMLISADRVDKLIRTLKQM